MQLEDQEQQLYEQRRLWKDECFDHVSLCRSSVQEGELLQICKSSSAGAVSSFFGTTRDIFEGKQVTHLEYDAYIDMALECMLEICVKIRQQWNVLNIVFQHKLGPCPVMETSIAIVISSAHRKESLQAVSYAIDELKRTVPIWKKEHYSDEAASWKANPDSINYS